MCWRWQHATAAQKRESKSARPNANFHWAGGNLPLLCNSAQEIVSPDRLAAFLLATGLTRDLMLRNAGVLLVALAVVACACEAKVLLFPSFIGSHMVFQRGVPFPVLGTAAPLASVSVVFQGARYAATADAKGQWQAWLPAQSGRDPPVSIQVQSSDGASATLEDIVFGDVYVCSGQSNMQLNVAQCSNASYHIREADKRPNIRLFQVANLASYYNVSQPQANLTASLHWARGSAKTVPTFSGACYMFGAQLFDERQRQGLDPMYLGLIESDWGGTQMEVWMSADAMAKCGEAAAGGGGAGSAYPLPPAAVPIVGDGPPAQPSTLWNAMVAPLTALPLTGWLWYQGESNAYLPDSLSKCFPLMIAQWRASFGHAVSPTAWFGFVQISTWYVGVLPPMIPPARAAQEAGLRLPNTSMVVSADIGDIASPNGDIHPVNKQEIGRRAVLGARALVYGESGVVFAGPRPVKLLYDTWDASWGNYHDGTGAAGFCSLSGVVCGGIRLFWDNIGPQGLSITDARSFSNGFEVLHQESTWQAWAPVPVTFIAGNMMQLNITTYKEVRGLRYGWADIPAMTVYSGGLPAPPFEILLGKDSQ